MRAFAFYPGLDHTASWRTVMQPLSWKTHSVRQGLFLLLILLLSSPVHAANYAFQLHEVKGYLLPDLSELEGAVIDLRSAPSIRRNPALISTREGTQFDLQYLYRTGDSRNATYGAMPLADSSVPASVQLGTGLGNLRLGVGWEQRYNSHREVQDTYLDTTDTRWKSWDSRLERWNVQAAWEIFPTTQERFGLTLGGGFARSSLRVDQVELQSYTGVMNWQFGLRVDLRGAYVAFGYEDKALFNTIDYLYMDNPSGGQVAVDSLYVWGAAPAVIHTQIGYVPAPGWEIDVNLRYYQYSGQLLYFDDRMENAVILHRSFSNGIRAQAGFVSSGTTALYGNDMEETYSPEMDTVFLLAGVQVPFPHGSFNLKIADSHLGGGDYRKQTQVQVGLLLRAPALPLPLPGFLKN
jgi:hypothetical protein